MKTSVEISHDTNMTDNISWVTATHALRYAISHGSGRLKYTWVEAGIPTKIVTDCFCAACTNLEQLLKAVLKFEW